MRSRKGVAGAGFMLVAASSGALVVGWVAAGGAWPIPVSLALLVTTAVTIYLARQEPDDVLAAIIRSNHPSADAYRRGVSAFQINGGRVPKPGEKPAPPYWRTK